MNHIVIIGTDPNYLVNFRSDLIKNIINSGHKVTAMSAPAPISVISSLTELGASFLPYHVERNSLSFMDDIKTFIELKAKIKKLNPDKILFYTIKPIIWGNIASFFLNKHTERYAMIEGLGYAFQYGGIKRRLLRFFIKKLYSFSLVKTIKVIFLNRDNAGEFLSNKIIPPYKSEIINGIGVDLQHYRNSSLPNKKITFLSIGRLLGEKGFREYAQAAQIVKAQYPETIFQLLGHEDPSPDGIPMNEVKGWHQCGYLEYLGTTTDVRPYLEQCHVFVLPSYHEGLPRTTMEAMATGRPILTTDVPGCRETVISGENGYLVPKANAEALTERMIWFIENRDQCERMGKRSRELAEDRYDVHKINKQLMEIMGLTVNGETVN